MTYQINKTKYLSKIELNQLLNKLQNDHSRNSLIIQLALATGARASELLAIRVSDLDMHNKSVFIKGLKNSFDREIPLKDDLFNALIGFARKSNHYLLFNISYPRLVQIWEQYKPINKKFHSLRHTFALNLYERTKDIALVKAALGHKNVMNSMVYLEYFENQSLLKKII